MKDDRSIDRLLKRTLPALEGQPAAGACLDAETVAAWSEGSLPAEVRAAAEAHAADCGRCLGILAAVARTEPAAPAEWWQIRWPLRWLVPLTAAATAVMLWVLVDQPPDRTDPRDDIAITMESPAVRDQQGQPAGAPAPDDPQPLKAVPSPGASPQRGAPAARTDGSAAPAAPPAAPVPREEDRVAAESAAAAGAPAASPAPAALADATTERRPVVAREASGEALEILSPDPAVRWRIAGGAIERSLDGGRTWLRQSTDGVSRLLAGSAPSPTVCWVAGRSGAVLLSTDGETWTRVPFPDTGDLVAITATDGSAAVVTTADGRRYRTTDAGRTWTLQENPPAPF